MNEKAKLTRGSVGKTLIGLTIPMFFGILGIIIFNLVDSFFVGKLGSAQLAALGFAFPIVMIIGGLAAGLGTGVSSIISHAIGKGDSHKIKRFTTDSLILSLLFAIFFVVIGLVTIDPLFRLLGASSEVMPYIQEYMFIWYIGVIFIIVPRVGNSAIRATGNMKIPALIMIVAAIINAVLDPFLIFGIGPFPRLEMAGAAIATVIAHAFTLIIAVFFLYYKEKMITLEIPQAKQVFHSWKKILHIGLPAAGARIIIPLAIGIITSIVATFGSDAVAGFGVAFKIEFLTMAVIMSLSVVIIPFIGQNWGVLKYDRIKSGIKYSYKFAILWGLISYIILVLFANPIASAFSNNPNIISIIKLYLFIVPIGFGLQGIFLISTSALNVLKKPIHSFLLIVIHTFILSIPLAYLGSKLFGLWAVFSAIPISFFIVGIVSSFILNKVVLNEEKSTAND